MVNRAESACHIGPPRSICLGCLRRGRFMKIAFASGGGAVYFGAIGLMAQTIHGREGITLAFAAAGRGRSGHRRLFRHQDHRQLSLA